MLTRHKLSNWALWVFESKWPYGMGCYGQRLQKQYPILKKSWYYTSKNPEGFKKLTELYNAGQNPRLYDCHGIVDGFRMDDDTTSEIEFDPSLDISADMEYYRVKASGVFGVNYGPVAPDMKDNAGYGYWKPGHFGIGVGDGQVVDIWNTGYPARKRDQMLGNWTYWLQCSGIDYMEVDDLIYCKFGDGRETATSSSKTVWAMQNGLVRLGYKMIGSDGKEYPADGRYGNASTNGVLLFKKANNIPGGGTEFDSDCLTVMLSQLSKLPASTGITPAMLDAEKARTQVLQSKLTALRSKATDSNLILANALEATK